MDNSEYEIHTDDRTVWVNADRCLGRFGLYGVDIMTPDGRPYDAGPGAWDARPSSNTTLGRTPLRNTTRKDWNTFVAKMKEVHGIDVPQKYMPRRLTMES